MSALQSTNQLPNNPTTPTKIFDFPPSIASTKRNFNFEQFSNKLKTEVACEPVQQVKQGPTGVKKLTDWYIENHDGVEIGVMRQTPKQSPKYFCLDCDQKFHGFNDIMGHLIEDFDPLGDYGYAKCPNSDQAPDQWIEDLDTDSGRGSVGPGSVESPDSD